MTTYGLRYHLNSNFNKYIKFFLIVPPGLMVFNCIWLFGNTSYVSTGNIKEDVIIEATGETFLNKWGQEVYYKENVYSNRELPLFVKKDLLGYQKQFLDRTKDSPFYTFLAYELLFFTAIIGIS